MLLSIIVPVFNSLPELMKCIGSLAKTTDFSKTELIIVDDASVEFDARELIGPPAKVLRNEKNSGFSFTCNVGATQSTGDYLLFLNSDIQVMPNWFSPLLQVFLQNPKVQIVGPKLLFPQVKIQSIDPTTSQVIEQTEPFKIQSCGGWYDVQKGPFHRYLGWNADDWRVCKTQKVSWVTGAAIMFRRDVFFNVGGFDQEYIRGYFEDVDICEKVKQQGGEVWYCADSAMIHPVGKSTNAKTHEEQFELAKIFRHNSMLFHSRWNDKIVPDVQIQMVPY